MLQWKRIFHVFSLDGWLTLQDNSELRLKGFTDVWAKSVLISSFEDFALSNQNLVSTSLKRWVTKPLLDATQQRKFKDYNHYYPFAIFSGWNGHSINIILYKNYFVSCNRGDDCGQHSGWTIYQIGSKKNLTEEFIESLENTNGYDKSSYISNEKIIKHLNAEEIYHCNMKSQTVGNCTYTSAKAAILALLTLWELSKNSMNGHFNAKMVEKAVENAKKIYKPFTNFDRQEVLNDFIADLEIYDNRRNDDNAVPTFYKDAIDKIKVIFAEKIYFYENIFTFGHKIGWERWLHFNQCLPNISAFASSNENTLRNIISLIFCNITKNDIAHRLSTLLAEFNNSNTIAIILEQINLHGLITEEQNFRIISELEEMGKSISHGLQVSLCRSFNKRIELIYKLIMKENFEIKNFIRKHDFQKLGFINDILKCKNPFEKIELIREIALLGSGANLKIESCFDKLLIIENIIECNVIKERIELTERVSSLGDWAIQILREKFNALGFLEDINKAKYFYQRLDFTNKVGSLGNWASDEIGAHFKDLGFLEDITQEKSSTLKMTFCRLIPSYGQWAVQDIIQSLTECKNSMEFDAIPDALIKLKKKRKHESETTQPDNLKLVFKKFKKG
ncbi:MAG: hypothetical protein H0W50_00185 [Parachlamydiaceae bacterium]|nr:hypothetical protein [Parachlamydiaceae bacterium]